MRHIKKKLKRISECITCLCSLETAVHMQRLLQQAFSKDVPTPAPQPEVPSNESLPSGSKDDQLKSSGLDPEHQVIHLRDLRGLSKSQFEELVLATLGEPSSSMLARLR